MGCDSCPLKKDSTRSVRGEGNPSPQVIFIGEAPGEEEVEQGRPFVGRAGNILRSALRSAQYPYFITNAVKCRPTKVSAYGNVINRRPSSKEISCCREYLLEELSSLPSAKLIVLLGGPSVQSVLKTNLSIKALRGSPIKIEGGIPCFVTYHPSAFLHNPDDKEKLLAFSQDMANIPKMLTTEFITPDITFVNNVDNLLKFQKYLLDWSHKPCVIDFETTELSIQKSEPLCIGLAWEENIAWIIPLEEGSFHSTIISLLKSLPHIICHNLSFDSQVSRRWFNFPFGRLNQKVDDTIIIHALLYPEESHKLEDLAFIFRPDLGNYKVKTTGKLMKEYPLEQVMGRCGYDVLATFSIYNQLREKVPANIYSLQLVTQGVLEEVMFKGVRVNRNTLEKIFQEYSQKIQELEKDIKNQMSEWGIDAEKVNVNSGDQMAHFFYNILKLPILKSGKKRGSVTASVIEELEIITKNPVVPLYKEYNSLTTLRDNTIKNLREKIIEDRLYTSYNIAGTSTGRLSSSKPNLQNVTKKLRRGFIPDREDEYLMRADANQMELRWAGIISKDPTFIRLYKEGRDLHQEILDKILSLGRPADRVKAKIVNFRMLFLASDFGISKELKIPLADAQVFIQVHRETFPQYWKWVSFIEKKIRAGEEIYTWWGRKRKFKIDDLRNAVNFPIQSSASDFLVLYIFPSLTNYAYAGRSLTSYIRLTTHDDIIFSGRIEALEVIRTRLNELTERFNTLIPLPLKFDFEIGKNWKELEPFDTFLLTKVV